MLPWHAASGLLVQVTPDEPPPKFAGGVVPVPWHSWQKENPVVAPGAAFASSPWGWAAGGAATQVEPTGCGAPASPWHNVPLKHPGAGLSGGGVGGWFAGLFADPKK